MQTEHFSQTGFVVLWWSLDTEVGCRSIANHKTSPKTHLLTKPCSWSFVCCAGEQWFTVHKVSKEDYKEMVDEHNAAEVAQDIESTKRSVKDRIDSAW